MYSSERSEAQSEVYSLVARFARVLPTTIARPMMIEIPNSTPLILNLSWQNCVGWLSVVHFSSSFWFSVYTLQNIQFTLFCFLFFSISLLSLHYTVIIISSIIQNYRVIFVQTISRRYLKPKSLSNIKLLNTLSLLVLIWYSSEGFEGSVNPSQPADIKNSLYW